MRSTQLASRLVLGVCTGLASLVLTFLPACASTSVETEWERIDAPHYVSEDGTFTLELPRGWLRSDRVLARDPDGTQAISFNAGPVLTGDEALAIDASAPELMQAMREQLAAQPGVKVLECTAITLDGLPGFRAHFLLDGEPNETSATPLKSEHMLYSAVDGEMLYAFALETTAGAEFAQDLPEFEAMVASFRRLQPKP